MCEEGDELKGNLWSVANSDMEGVQIDADNIKTKKKTRHLEACCAKFTQRYCRKDFYMVKYIVSRNKLSVVHVLIRLTLLATDGSQTQRRFL